ncbi:cilia- and flagella-associated protein 52 [Tachypleus tridentatus]|uniref:cilia- and flagella-associated protein 52 n=1 Tax=Tachypleus tridentatus TaxID=6853 RepID=UPI003FD66856
MDKDDEHCYCGTTSGDILKIRIRLEKGENGIITVCPVLTSCLTRKIPKKKKDEPLCFSKGVTALILLKSGQMIVGTGNGTICRVVEKEMDTPSNLYNVTASSLPKTTTNKGKGEIRLLEVKRTSVHGSVTSITPRGDGHQLFIGTNTCQIYRINLMEFSCHLLYTCHSFPVLDVTFPYDCSQLFATCSKEHIRIWNISSGQELLPVTVPNMTCHSIEFMRDGKSIISAWDDGKIRAFTPRTGQTIFTINDAHNRGVTAITTTTDCKRIISGGGEGEVRVWDITASKQVLRETMKEHKGPVSCIKVRSNDKECISASTDGTCIIWDLQRFIRSQVIFANTLFKCVCYGPEECQLITSGTDRKIGYWEVYDGSLIRELEGSKSGSVNAMDISHDGQVFVTGGNDKIVKVWKYQEGEVTHVGIGHSGDINKLKISPTDQYIVTVSNDGAILIWSFPKL